MISVDKVSGEVSSDIETSALLPPQADGFWHGLRHIVKLLQMHPIAGYM